MNESYSHILVVRPIAFSRASIRLIRYLSSDSTLIYFNLMRTMSTASKKFGGAFHSLIESYQARSSQIWITYCRWVGNVAGKYLI
jgi:hypothetical protein